MEKLFAAVISDKMGLRIFYVGETTESEAAKTLVREKPELAGSDARFYSQPGQIAAPLGVNQGGVLEWVSGTSARLTALTGTVTN